MTRPKRRFRRHAISLVTVLGVLALPSSAVAGTETFYRFEENATANWTIIEECADETTSTTFVQVIGGLEFESPDLQDVDEFVTIRILNFFTCEGEFVNESGTGPASYTGTKSLRNARVSGTVTLRSGDLATIDLSWVGFGPLEKTVRRTERPGFIGVFKNKERQAVATGGVFLDNWRDLLSGPSQSGSIETLEDRNISADP